MKRKDQVGGEMENLCCRKIKNSDLRRINGNGK